MYEILKKMMFCMQPENAHEFAMFFLKNWHKCQILDKFSYEDESLKNDFFNLEFKNPIGMAAGFDKDAVALNALAHLGFGFMEFGAVTPKPQSGNPKPRLFRLKEDFSLQNAMGFNNIGLKAILINLEKQQKIFKNQNLTPPPIFANIGKNKDTKNENAMSDYECLVQGLDNACDGFVVNISSPNTKNLRDLQNESFVKELFLSLNEKTKKPCLLKIAPDMSVDEALKVCNAGILGGAKGVIVANTTKDYSLSKNSYDIGGLSGRVLKNKSRELLKELAKDLFGKTTIISSGGIEDAEDVLYRLEHGASLVQIYTAFIYQGPMICKNINSNLANLLKSNGYKNIKEAIGAKI